jgi:hypothetical protein
MLGRLCQQFADKLRSHFEFLYSEHDFKLEHLEEASAGERCLLVLQGQFRIKFLFGKGDLEVFVGRSDAPMIWEDKIGGVRTWLPIWGIVRYVAGEPKLTSKTLKEFGKRLAGMATDEYLAEVASSLRTEVSRIAEFLGRADFSEELGQFEEYFYT